ncbi:MAG TPA: YegS/Rv2252/BmrU family lipid kinase [Longimicrobiales bacterium]|nr:YegS/Rv2252/BmrU family lipid kinase [Longimicrobiales bacterium]
MKRSIAVVVRPPGDEARLEALRAAVEAVRSAGHRVGVRLTFEGGDARRFARSAARAGWDVVVAAGGDGTVNEVVNGLARVHGRTLMGVVPMGTANDFASSLGVPEDLEAALRLAAEGPARAVDVARVNRRCFINVSTGGFGADTSQEASRALKKHLGGFAYVLRGVENMMKFEVHSGRFSAGGEVVHDGEFMFFAVGNARQTGGGTPLTPLAEVGDGRLDIMLVHGISRLQFMALLPDLRAGTHLDSPHVSYYRADRFDVEDAGDIVVNADGEHVAGEAYHYDVLARPLHVVTGATDPIDS